jgi:peptidoglycan-associated lipoprotein
MRMHKTLIGLGFAALALTLVGCAATPRPRALVISQQCADLDFPVYFNRFSAKLSGPALQVIADAGKAAQGCTVANVSVTGLSGGRPDGKRNLLDLSSKRATAVAKALTNAGLPAPRFDVTAVATTTPAGADSREPLQRRAEVVIQFAH